MPSTLQAKLAEARHRASIYQWSSAAQLIQEALQALQHQLAASLSAPLYEEISDYLFKAAFQSSTREDFLKGIEASKEACQEAASEYERHGSPLESARLRSKSLLTIFWGQSTEAQRRGTIRKSIDLLEEAIRMPQYSGGSTVLAKAGLDLLIYLEYALDLATDWEEIRFLFAKASEVARSTIDKTETRGDSDLQKLESLHGATLLFAVSAQFVLDPSEFKALSQETQSLATRLELQSQRMGSDYALCLAKEELGDVAFNLEGDYSKADKLYREAVFHAKKTRDTILLGRLFWRLSTVASWKAASEAQTERRREALKEGLEQASEAIKNLEVPYDTTYLAAAHSSGSNCLTNLALSVDVDTSRKSDHLQKAVDMAKRGTTIERHTWATRYNSAALARALVFLASVETNATRKKQLLLDALSLSEELVRLTDKLLPNSWNRGVVRRNLALARSELVENEPNPNQKLRMISQASSDMQESVVLCTPWATTPGLRLSVARSTELHGDLLYKLYLLSKDSNHAISSITAYQNAISSLLEQKDPPPLGPLRWKIARVLDNLGNLQEARSMFGDAAKEYALVATKISGLRSTFEELALYMKAWAFIEEARLHHGDEEYELASESYEQAGRTLGSTRTWDYATELCIARSIREKGELLSIEEDHVSSEDSFRRAAQRFSEGEKRIRQSLEVTTDSREQDELQSWLKASAQQGIYASARADLEKARALEQRGEKGESGRKFQSAAEMLRKLVSEIDNVEDRAEVESLVGFCNSWARMKEAESKLSPQSYLEASESFLRIRDTSTRRQTQLLAAANASICKALSFGTRFRQTRDVQLYSEIKKQLETAADYFKEAGFTKTESWTRATERLFDALVFLADAESERDPKKKTELYSLAEKHLELTARLYGSAGFPSRRREALDHLDRAREEKEVLLASMEALSRIPSASGVVLKSVALAKAQPLGVERFEQANVVADLNARITDVLVGSQLSFEVDIANVGATPATLVKMQEVAPAGLEVNREKTPHQVGDGYIDLEGKRLDHLKTHKVQITLTAIRKGLYEIQPRIFFADDRGSYMSYQLRPTSVTVLDPSQTTAVTSNLEGIPPRVSLPEGFRFETQRAREVFNTLVNEFLKDYVSKRLHMDNAGWRSLMGIIREVKIPRSALYGPAGRVGPVLAELERRGLVEVRIFPRERGRGGAVKKLRVAYDNLVVRDIIQKAVMEKT